MDVRSALNQLAFILRAVADDVGEMMEREDVAPEDLAGILDQIGLSAKQLELVALRSVDAKVGTQADRQESTDVSGSENRPALIDRLRASA